MWSPSLSPAAAPLPAVPTQRRLLHPADWPLAVKMGVLPLVALAAMGGVIAYATLALQGPATAAGQARLLTVGLATAAALLPAGATLLLARSTVRAVRDIAAATRSVARGEAPVAIARLHRGDELGAIVDSLAVFQGNVARIAFLAHHDALTGLPNRALLQDRLQQALAQVGRGSQFALHSVDIYRFKAVNDALGHPVGDGLLCQVANRLAGCVREGDTVARLGADEFAVLQLDVTRSAEAAMLAQRICDALGQPYVVEGQRIVVGACVGIALTPQDGLHPEKLLRNANIALHRAMAEGSGTVRFFEQDMDVCQQSRRALELDMRKALDDHEFELFYQPILNAETLEVVGFEALLRWPHPDQGMIPPAVFIPVAEDTGLILPLGIWVLRTACREAARWPANLKLSVNLSAAQLKDRSLVAAIRAALHDADLSPRRLELEITESVLLQKDDPTLATLHAIRAMGVHIAMDDFGTGYSSLGYLRSFPFDKIKIDQSFIRDLPDAEALAIVRAVTGLGRSLGVTTTAEGVEQQQQLDRLAAEGCTEVQGYLFSRPRPARDIPGLLAQLAGRVRQGVA